MRMILDVKNRLRHRFIDGLRMKHIGDHDGETLTNEDLRPVPLEERVWVWQTFASYWISESWGASTWAVGSSLVAGGLLWWHAFLAVLVGHGIASLITVWNGRSGATYHINFPTMIRATFGIRGAYIPVLVRIVLDLVWYAVQSYFGGQFLDIMFQCVFGHHWKNIRNGLPSSSGTTTRAMAAYFIFWFFQMVVSFFRPHEMKPLYYFKAITMPVAMFGLFIWCLVRSGGPGTIELGEKAKSSSVLGWTFMAAMNSAINGEFGPLIASEPDITRYARSNRDQVIGQLLVAPWSATVVALLGIIAAACTQKIYGEAYWQPALILDAILAEDNSSKTKFAVFLVSIVFVVGLMGTNYVSNVLPFGVDATIMAPRYLNFIRAAVLCGVVGGWCLVPWKIVTSGASFLTAITGIGIFMSTLVGILLADYFFVRKGNYWVSDLYTTNPNGRYWYTGGFHWRAYAAYVCGIAVPFPGFLGSLGVKGVKNPQGAAYHIYDIGYLTAFVISITVYTAICKISPPSNVAEARALPFEHQARELDGAVLEGQDVVVEDDIMKEMTTKDIEAKA